MTKAGSAILTDPLLARKGDAAPTGFRRAETLPAVAANSNGTNGSADPGPGPSSGPETPQPEPGDQASLLTCMPLKASFIGLETPDIDEATETARPEKSAIKVDAAALPSSPSQAKDSWPRRLLIVLALALLCGLGWAALNTPSKKGDRQEPLQERSAVTAPAETAVTAAPEALPEPLQPEAPANSAPDPNPIGPTFDVVRIEANGDAVIAGRGAAFSELVILDNGQPIGTAKADADGQWLLIPDMPLNQGGHNFSLAVKADGSTVILPEPGTADDAKSSPAIDDQSRLETEAPSKSETQRLASTYSAASLPLRKPELMAALGAEEKLSDAYEIQMVSVPSVAGASRELRRLKRDFPEILANLDLRIDEKSYSDKRRRYRVRTGPFVDKTAAEALCERLNASQQDCLVIKQ